MILSLKGKKIKIIIKDAAVEFTMYHPSVGSNPFLTPYSSPDSAFAQFSVISQHAF